MNVGEELQRGLFGDITADIAIMALINGVYDEVPPEAWDAPKESYVSWGASDITDDSSDCIESGTYTFQIDVWSRIRGFLTCRNIVDLIKERLKSASMTLNENAIIVIRIPLARVVRDPDGITSHGTITVEIDVEVN